MAIVIAGVLSWPGQLQGQIRDGDGSLVGHGKAAKLGFPAQALSLQDSEKASRPSSSASPLALESAVKPEAAVPGEVSEHSLRQPLNQSACSVCLLGTVTAQWSSYLGSGSFYVPLIYNYRATATGPLRLQVILVSLLPVWGGTVSYSYFSDPISKAALAPYSSYSSVNSGTIPFYPSSVSTGIYWALIYLIENQSGTWYYDDWSVLLGAVHCDGTSCTSVPCVEDATTMCLIGGRYSVSSQWKNQYAGGAVSNLNRASLTDATGAFWITDSSTFEYLIRIQTGTNNGRAWIAIPTFTDVEFWITVHDLFNTQVGVYHSLPGNRTLIFDPTYFVFP